jgi:hypothetical protein
VDSREATVLVKQGSRSILSRDQIAMIHHRDLACCLRTIFSENRCTLFRIMRNCAGNHS